MCFLCFVKFNVAAGTSFGGTAQLDTEQSTSNVELPQEPFIIRRSES